MSQWLRRAKHKVLNDNFDEGQKYCRMLPLEIKMHGRFAIMQKVIAGRLRFVMQRSVSFQVLQSSRLRTD